MASAQGQGILLLDRVPAEQRAAAVHAALDRACAIRDSFALPPGSGLAPDEAIQLEGVLVGAAADLCGEGCDQNAIAERVRGKGVSPEAAEPFAEACEARREQILRAMAENATRAGHASLREVDWSVRLTMGSSTITGVRDAAATVKLTLDAPAGFNRRSSTGVAAQDSFTLELSKAELDDVLTQCDEIDQALRG